MNGQNVVKVGHRQVVNMIRQGGNSLMVKVVMVARNPELEDTARKRGTSQIFVLHHLNSVFIMWWLSWLHVYVNLKACRNGLYTRILNIKSAFGWLPLAAPQQTKRLTPPAIALRSKSMTSELEDMGKTKEGTKRKSMSSGGHIEKASSGVG